MSQQRHVILRKGETSTRGGTRGGPGAGPATVAPARPVAVEVEELNPAKARAVAKTKDVVAIAPVMPMKLIAPVALNLPAQPAAATVTWGVQAVGADTSPFTGNAIVVAVLDTGIDPNHPAFAGVELVRKNFTDAGDDDDHGHGTHCAGTIFGRDVNNTRIGIARGVKKAMIGKVLGGNGGGSDMVMQAIQWATNSGANVISMSLGIDFPGFVKELEGQGVPTELATSMALEGYRANVLLFERLASLISAQNLLMQATLLVAAAGNESQRDVNADFEIAVSPPAVSDGIVSVAALGQGAQGFTVATFSNTGAKVSGPGVGVISAKRGGGLTSMSGTSMATPHVAGVAALWAEKLTVAGQLNASLLMNRLIGSATAAGIQAGTDPTDVGAGMVQAPQS
jgi:subtilisin family serine protease